MKEIEVSGNTVEEAIQKGLARIAMARDRVEIQILAEGRAGLFGLMGAEPARVRLTEKSEEGVSSKTVERTRQFCICLLEKMGASARVAVAPVEGRMAVSIRALRDGGLLIGKNGETLEALQVVLRRWLNMDRTPPLKISVDVEGYRTKQESRLVELAQKAADRAKRTGRPAAMDPLPATQRRIIHLALAGDKEVRTSSEGEGRGRKVVIYPR